jgi:hypothetical protein
MAAKIKPVELTVIKDKKIVREVIVQVRWKPTAEDRFFLIRQKKPPLPVVSGVKAQNLLLRSLFNNGK